MRQHNKVDLYLRLYRPTIPSFHLRYHTSRQNNNNKIHIHPVAIVLVIIGHISVSLQLGWPLFIFSR